MQAFSASSSSSVSLGNPFPSGSSLWRYFGSLSSENRALVFDRFRWLEDMKTSSSSSSGQEADMDVEKDQLLMQALFFAMRINE
jgi:hypothetical protein